MPTPEQLLEIQNEHWRSSRPILVEALLNEHSIALDQLKPDEILNLICNEIRLREDAGDRPQLAEYQSRFPSLASELETQWQVDALLAPHDDSLNQETAGQSGLPDRIGRYEVMREVGRGSSSVVYEGFDDRLNRTVAIKHLHPGHWRDGNEAQRIRLEAETIAKLNHPHIVSIYDVGVDAGSFYIVMEYCEDGTLSELTSANPLAARPAANFARQIASAVSVAHAASIIHRDLKPANILLTQSTSGETICKVSDFGLAKWLDASDTATMTHGIVGSPAYMSPEQAMNEKQNIGTASDVYSLGAILFQMLTGRPPFLGSSIADTLHQVETSEPLRVRQLNPQVPLDLETIVSKCLKKDRGQRYQDARDLTEELDRFLAGRAILAKPESTIRRLARSAKRNPALTAMVTTVSILLLSIVVGSIWFSLQLNEALQVTRRSERESQLKQAEALLGKANGRRVSQMPGRRLVSQDILREAIEIGHRLGQPSSWFDKFRDEAIETMWLSDLAVTQWRETESKVVAASFSLDERLLATIDSEHELVIQEWTTNRTVARRSVSPQVQGGFIGNDQIVLLSTDAITILRLQGDSLVESWQIKSSQYSDSPFQLLFFAKQQGMVAFATNEQILFFDADSGKLHSQTPLGQFGKPFISIHPTKPLYLISSYHHRMIELRNLATHEVLWRKRAETNGPTSTCWSSEGDEFASLASDGDCFELYQFDVDNAPRLVEARKGMAAGANAVWTSNRQLLLSNWDNGHGLYDMVANRFTIDFARTGLLTNFILRGAQIKDDTRRIGIVATQVDSEKSIGLLEMATGAERRILLRPEIGLVPGLFACSNSGDWAVISHRDGLQFVNLRDGSTLGHIRVPGAYASRVAIDNHHIHVVTTESSIRLDWQIANGGLILSDPQRSQLQPGFAEICISEDGESMIAGHWNGYSDTQYCGVWLKNRHEPALRKLFGHDSGKYSAISPDSRAALVYYYGQSYLVDVEANLDRHTKLGAHDLHSPLAFSRDGTHAISCDRLWSTSNWTEISLRDANLAGSVPYLFSADGQHVIYRSKDGLSQFVDLQSDRVYLQLDGMVLYYDSKTGKLLLQSDHGLEFRNLDQAAEKLVELGLQWTGPNFVPVAINLRSVRLDTELQKSKTYSEAMDFLDQQAIQRAEKSPSDGPAIFQAAMVQMERGNSELALGLLEACSRAMPKSIMALQWQAYILASKREWQAAIDIASPIIDKTNDTSLRLLRATWYLELDDPEKAIADCVEAEKANQHAHRRSIAIQVLAFRQLGDSDREIEFQNQWVAGRSNDRLIAEAILPMVTHDVSLRNVKLAEYYCQQLTELDQPEVKMALAWTRLRSGDYQAAIDTAKSLLNDSTGEFYALANLACAMSSMKVGETSQANEYLETARKVHADPQSRAYHDLQVRLLIAEAARMVD